MRKQHIRYLLAIATLSGGLLVLTLQLTNGRGASEATSCAQIDHEPAERTFELAYCKGVFCESVPGVDGQGQTVRSKAACERIDVIMGQPTRSGSDGKPDCQWDDTVDPLNAWTPNL
jgi:hypothetical protein